MAYSPQELLYAYGFVKGDDKKKTVEQRKEKLKKAEEGAMKKLLESVEEEILEQADAYFAGTGYPESLAAYRLTWESPNQSIEETYFWVLEHLRQDRGFHTILKITDLYSSSEASAFFGNQQGRIANQQNMAQGLLANIGKFVRDTFQMVRELRIIEERLESYEKWHQEKDEKVTTSDSADVVLKSIYTDLAEGGTKNPQSVFGLAQNVQFTLLPDLFFQTRVYSEKDIDKKLKDMDYNESLKTVLRRKLSQFLVWKKATHEELKNRYRFNISYLRQHWSIIQTYMSWAKPLLKNIRHLQQQPTGNNPDLIHSFDTNMTEIELLAKGKPSKGAIPVVIASMRFRTRPEMEYKRQYQQQTPQHTGRLEMTFRSYAWTEEQITNYQAMRNQEEFDLIGVLDEHLGQTMDFLGEDFERYITGKEKELPKKEEKKAVKSDFKTDAAHAFEPFIAIFGGFGEIFGAFFPTPNKDKKKGKKESSSNKPDFKGAGKTASLGAFLTWHIYKKTRQMMSW